MSAANSSGIADTASHRETGDNPSGTSTTGRDEGGGDLRFNSEKTVRVSPPDVDKSDDVTVDADAVRVPESEKEDYQLSSSVNNKNSESRSNGGEAKQKKVRRAVGDDYDSNSLGFDSSTTRKSKDEVESIGFGFQVGDMVWGKVKSHPWWPGHILNEAFASPSVRRSKREGHVLVAFFGDSSYGWFEPAELIHFEENFVEKSKQTSSRGFINAVEEAIDEVCRRSGVGLVCRCRNNYNFWPSKVEGYFTVGVGAYEPEVYSLSQINSSRDSFQPQDMLSFLQKVALAPLNDQRHRDLDFLKNKSRVLACRKALFEEFDETYAQAFGSAPVRPVRPTSPVSVVPSQAALSGRLVIAEALGKGKVSAKPTKTRDQMEKDRYLFKRRDEPVQVKSKKMSAPPSNTVVVDGSGYSGKKSFPAHTKPTKIDSEGPQREGGTKKPKAKKRPAEEISSGGEVLVEKKQKKEIISKTNAAELDNPNLPAENIVATDSVPTMPLNDTNQPENQDVIEISENQKDAIEAPASPAQEVQQPVDFKKFELTMLVRDLRSLALNPFHGEERCCPAIVRRVFWKFRSLVYKKSLSSLPNEATSKLPVAPLSSDVSEKNISKSTEKSTEKKLLKPSVRPDDPTKGGMKRGPLETLKKKRKIDDASPEDVKKRKKLSDNQEDFRKRKALNFLEDIKEKKKNKIDESSKIPHMRSSEAAGRNIQSTKGRIDKSNRVPNPTMLILKFPINASLPSSAELRAKFARFGQLDHSATRVFWKSFQCRLVYQYKSDAEGALRFASGNSNNLFGSRNVRSFIKAVGAPDESGEPSSSKVVVTRPTIPKITVQPSNSQLKSILKKPAGEEGGNGNGKGNSPRVKFVLGGEDEPGKGGAASSSFDNSSKNVPNFVTTTIATPGINVHNFPMNVSMGMASSISEKQELSRVFNVDPPLTKDISQPMLNLLMKCSDVVNNVTRVLGYLPYHPI